MITTSNLKEVDQGLALSGKTVDNILGVIGDGCLEKEAEVAQAGPESLAVDLHAREQLAQNDHVDHQRHCEQTVLADVVAADGVCAAHEDARRVLVQRALAVAHERHLLDHHLVVNFIIILGLQNGVGRDGVVQHAALADLLGLETLVLGQVFAVVVAQVVLGDHGGQAQARADDEVRHDGFEARLPTLEVAARDEAALLARLLHHGGVEGVLRRAVQLQHALLDGS